MLNYSIMKPEGILVLQAHAPLGEADFKGLSATVDVYLTEHAKLHGVLVQSQGFPGWENFGGFTAHMHFVSEHHKKIERLAIVTDSPFAGIAELLGKHFTSAEVRHFPFSAEAMALDWLKAT